MRAMSSITRLVSKTFVLAGPIVALLMGYASPAHAGAATVPSPPIRTNEYIIGPGDMIQIFVWHNPDLSASVPVRPDGKVSIPLVEDIPSSGKTPTQLARDIEERLRKFVQDPTVTVIMSGFIGLPSQQIRIVGQATQPKAVPYRTNMSVLDAMIEVGGLTTFAAGNRARLVRIVNGEQVNTIVRLRDLLESGDLTANIPLEPGDIILIPQTFF
jgi:polysaccharide export outer membrane protein